MRGATRRLGHYFYAALGAAGLMQFSSSTPLLCQSAHALPSAEVVALDGHKVVLPRDLSAATVMIVGFSRASQDATTAWEIPVRTKLAGGAVGFYDVAVLGSVPGLLHGWVTRAIRGKVPEVLRPRFLPVFADEASWKQFCGYDPMSPDAAYVVLVDKSGSVLWQTHEPFSAKEFDKLSLNARQQSVANRQTL